MCPQIGAKLIEMLLVRDEGAHEDDSRIVTKFQLMSLENKKNHTMMPVVVFLLQQSNLHV